jgi:hypothetical protein
VHLLFDNIVSRTYFLVQNRSSTTESQITGPRPVGVVDLRAVATDPKPRLFGVAPAPGKRSTPGLEATASGMDLSLGVAVARALEPPLRLVLGRRVAGGGPSDCRLACRRRHPSSTTSVIARACSPVTLVRYGSSTVSSTLDPRPSTLDPRADRRDRGITPRVCEVL